MKRVSQRVVVQASVVARVLGVRLLKLDASVLIAPAERNGSAARRLREEPVHYTPVHYTVEPAVGLRPRSPRSIGAGLDDAQRAIEEGAASRASVHAP